MRTQQDGVQVTRKKLDFRGLNVSCCIQGTIGELGIRGHPRLLWLGGFEGGGNEGRRGGDGLEGRGRWMKEFLFWWTAGNRGDGYMGDIQWIIGCDYTIPF